MHSMGRREPARAGSSSQHKMRLRSGRTERELSGPSLLSVRTPHDHSFAPIPVAQDDAAANAGFPPFSEVSYTRQARKA